MQSAAAAIKIMIRTIEDFPDYRISSEGEVYSTKGRSSQLRKLTPSLTIRGYRTLDLYYNGYRQKRYLHRLLAEAFIPNPERLKDVYHINGDKRDNSLANLSWGTQADTTRVSRLARRAMALNSPQPS